MDAAEDKQNSNHLKPKGPKNKKKMAQKWGFLEFFLTKIKLILVYFFYFNMKIIMVL